MTKKRHQDPRYSYKNIPASEWAPKELAKRFTKAKRAFILAVRMDQKHYFTDGNGMVGWCNVQNPCYYSERGDMQYVCSRPVGHDGFHFAQESGTGNICDIPNNPWLSKNDC